MDEKKVKSLSSNAVKFTDCVTVMLLSTTRSTLRLWADLLVCRESILTCTGGMTQPNVFIHFKLVIFCQVAAKKL